MSHNCRGGPPWPPVRCGTPFDFDSELLQLAIEGWARVVKDLCAEFDVAGRPCERLQDCFTLDLFDRRMRWNYEGNVARLIVLHIARAKHHCD